MIQTRSQKLTVSFLLRLAAACIGIAATAAGFAASLEWTQDSLSFETDFDTEEVVATYAFANNGATAVTIVETSSSCGCTIPTLDKKVYAPGEAGELTAVFTIGSRQGLQHKTIAVATEDADGNNENYELKLEVDIPIPVTFKPRVLFWATNSEASTKEVEINFHEKLPMNLAGFDRKDAGEPEHYDYEIVTVTEGLKYILKATPKTTEEKSRDVLFLKSEQDEKEILKRYPIYIYVR